MASRHGQGRTQDHPGKSSIALAKAATLRFATQGYDATPLREIAQDAGVDVALISYHFGGKTGLWKAIVTGAATDLHRTLNAATETLATTEALARLRTAMQAFIAYLLARPEIPRLLLRDITIDTDRSDWLLQELSAPLHQHFYALAQAAATTERCAKPEHLQFRVANFIYSAASTVARRDRLTRLVANIDDDSQFAEALETILIDEALRCG